jgi:hypothetical protein
VFLFSKVFFEAKCASAFLIHTTHEVPTIHLKANQKSSIEHRLSLVMAPLTCRIVLLLLPLDGASE